jgi:glutamate dehydrogenase/leucine dehydrogenase
MRPEPSAVFDAVSTKLRASAEQTLEASRARAETTHDVARTTARSRVAEAMQLKGRRRSSCPAR